LKRFAACGTALLLALVLLSGCGRGEKVAVRINKDVVTEDEFNRRAQNINGPELYTAYQRGIAARAGELALLNIIQEKLILQMAAAKNALPTDAQITAYMEWAKKYPRLSTQLGHDTEHSEAETRRDMRVQLAFRNMTLKPLNITRADLQKVYDDPLERQRIAIPDRYHLRLITVGTPQKAKDALDALNKNVPFETVALKMSDNPLGRQNSGDIGWRDANDPRIQSLIAAVQGLKPLAYTPKPIQLNMQMPTGALQPTYAIVQMVEKKPGRMPTLDEVKLYLEERVLPQKDPGIFARMQDALREDTKNADIQVNLKQYEKYVSDMQKAAALPASGSAPAP
jgi:hypothetical protein